MFEVSQQTQLILGIITFLVFSSLKIKNISSNNDAFDIIIDLDKMKEEMRKK